MLINPLCTAVVIAALHFGPSSVTLADVRQEHALDR